MRNTFVLVSSFSLTLIREYWKKNPKRGTITDRVLRKEIQSAALNRFVYVSVLWIFFSEMTLGDGPKNPRVRVKQFDDEIDDMYSIPLISQKRSNGSI